MTDDTRGGADSSQRAAATLEEILNLVDRGAIDATPAERAYLAGVLTGMISTRQHGLRAFEDDASDPRCT